MIVAAGSGCTHESHSIATSVVDITSSVMENPLSCTFARAAAILNSARIGLRSSEGRRELFLMILAISTFLSVPAVRIWFSSSAISDWIASISHCLIQLDTAKKEAIHITMINRTILRYHMVWFGLMIMVGFDGVFSCIRKNYGYDTILAYIIPKCKK